jgi:glycerophosphoryl diester phosphodiesterase
VTPTLAVALVTLSAGAPPAVEIIAHRGASHDAPENTVAAFHVAWEQRADAAELDVYLTKDGRLAVIHDKDTKRTAEGKSLVVAESTFADLRALDVGRWKAERFKGEKIPSLPEMFATVPDGRRVFVEVKCGPEAVPELVRVLSDSKLKPTQTPVIAFDSQVIAAVKKARPEVPAYWLVNLTPKNADRLTADAVVEKARTCQADGVDVSASPLLDAAYVKTLRAAGLKLYVWTVNDVPTAKRLVELKVDGITTDRPGWLREQLAD